MVSSSGSGGLAFPPCFCYLITYASQNFHIPSRPVRATIVSRRAPTVAVPATVEWCVHAFIITPTSYFTGRGGGWWIFGVPPAKTQGRFGASTRASFVSVPTASPPAQHAGTSAFCTARATFRGRVVLARSFCHRLHSFSHRRHRVSTPGARA